MSIVSGTIGALSAADSQDKATRANRKNAKETNELNYKMFRQSRGEGGSAVMPLYMKRADGSLFETGLSEDLIGDWDAMRSTITPGTIAGASGQTEAARNAARATATGIFDGANERQRLANFAPVKTARVAFKRQAALDNLNKTLGEINAMQATKGFTGDSLGNRLLRFRANKMAGDELGAINLQNLEEERSIRDQALAERVANINLPYQLQQADINALRMPTDSYIDQILRGLQPLAFLRIGGSQPFQYQSMPLVQPGVNPMQIMAQANAGAGNMALDYFMKKQQQDAWLNAAKNKQFDSMLANDAKALSSASAGSSAFGTGTYGAEVSPEAMDYLSTVG